MMRLVSLTSVLTLLASAAFAQVNMQPLSIVPVIQTSPAPAAAKPVRRTPPLPPLPPPRPSFEAQAAEPAPQAPAAAPVISGSVAIIPAPALAVAPPAVVATPAPEAKPADAKVSEIKPAETKLPEVKQADDKAAEIKPPAKPAESKPAEAKTVEAKPSETKPVEAKTVEAKTVDAKPVDAKPVEPQAAASKAVEQKPAEIKAATPLSFAGPATQAIVTPPAPAATAATEQAAEFRPRNAPTQPGMFAWMYGATVDMAGQIWTGARDQAARLLWSGESAPSVQRDELFRQAMAQAGFDVENATTEGFLVSYETIVFVARRQATPLERERAAELGAELAKLGGWRSYIEQAALRRAMEPSAPGALPLQSLEVQLWPYPWIKSVLGPMKPR